MLICMPLVAQVRKIESSWVIASQPIKWESPPRKLHLGIKTGVAELVVLYPTGEYGLLGCYLIRQADGTISISRGDSHVVGIGTWKRSGKEVTVTSRTVYRDVLITGRPLPDAVEVESFTEVGERAYRRTKDRRLFTPIERLRDLEFLSTLISCDRTYWDGHKPIEGPEPCMAANPQ